MVKASLIFVLFLALAVEQSLAYTDPRCTEDRYCPDSDCATTEYAECALNGSGWKECTCRRKSVCVFDRECTGKVGCPDGVKEVCSGGRGAYCMCYQEGMYDDNSSPNYQGFE